MNTETTLPPLPEWSLRDDLGGLVPSEIRQALREYAEAAIAAAQPAGEPVAWISEVQCIGPDFGKRFYGDMPIQSLQNGYYRHIPLYSSPPLSAPPEGCTPADARILREANHKLSAENELLRSGLRFYAAQQHFLIGDDNAWDTISGEPQNFWCDEAGTATVEDGAIAAIALRGEPLDWGDDPPPVCKGEPEYAILNSLLPDAPKEPKA